MRDSLAHGVALEAVEKRRLTFDVKVTGANGEISEGTHQRAVVDAHRFG